MSWLRVTHTRARADFHRIRFLRVRLPFEQEYTTGGWIMNRAKRLADVLLAYPPGSSWKKFLFFAQAFISGLRRGWPLLKIEVILEVIAGGITQLLSNFSFCNFLLKPSICSSLDGYRRGKNSFQLCSGLYNLFPHYYTLQFSLSPKNFLPRLPLPK